jgi:hypothetical protein
LLPEALTTYSTTRCHNSQNHNLTSQKWKPQISYEQILVIQYNYYSPPKVSHFDALLGLEWSNDPDSYTGGGIATGSVSLARQIKGDDLE